MKYGYFTPKMKMADLVSANHMLILLMPRLGLSLGFGEMSLQELCEREGVSVAFVLLVFNVYSFDSYQPDERVLNPSDMSCLVPYLRESHRYYLKERLPHIEKHLMRVAQHAGERYGEILKKFFVDYRHEVKDHFDCEECEVFPYMERLLKGEATNKPMSEHFADNHSDMIEKLQDLTQIVYKYLPGNAMTEELNELVFGVMQLSADLEKHALLEEKILLPYIHQLERSVL